METIALVMTGVLPGAGFLRRDEVVGIFKEVAPTVRVTAVEEVRSTRCMSEADGC